MDYKITQYRNWMNENISLTNAFSEESMRAMAYHVLMGRYYRLITENNTKSKLALTYLWLSDVVKEAQSEYGDEWKAKIVQDLMDTRHRTDEQKDLLLWLVGLTQKTSKNLGIQNRDLPTVMQELQEYDA